MKPSKRNLAALAAKAKAQKPDRSKYALKGGSYSYDDVSPQDRQRQRIRGY